MVNIFESAKEKVMPEWAKFVTAGDSTQGTYVGKIIGQIDGYGNEQVIYQLLQDNGKIVNVGFGLNKKVINADMQSVKFGQIIGFRYKGKLTVKDKFGKPVEVKDFSLHQDPKIVNELWLKENAGNMPKVTHVTDSGIQNTVKKTEQSEDVPFSSKASLTNEDKLVVIEKLAKEKLGATDSKTSKEKVMESTGIAFIPINYQKIIDALVAM